MKQISPIFFFILILFSCEKGKNPSLKTNSAPSRAGFVDSSEKIELNPFLGLEIQIPLSNEQLRKWIPEKVGLMEQRKLIVGHKQGMGMSGAIATFQINGEEENQISLEVLDGAGSTGVVLLRSISQKLSMDYEEQTKIGYSRIYEVDGIRVWEKLNSKDHHSEIEFVMQERYHFIFKGHGIEMLELWTFVGQVRKEMS